jgi:hypothetical protein
MAESIVIGTRDGRFTVDNPRAEGVYALSHYPTIEEARAKAADLAKWLKLPIVERLGAGKCDK